MRKLKYVKLFEDFKVKESQIDEAFSVNRDGSWGAKKSEFDYEGTGGSSWRDEYREKEEKMIKSKVFEFFKECESDLELKKSVDEVNADIERFTEENNISQLEDAKMRKVNLFLDKAKKTEDYKNLQNYQNTTKGHFTNTDIENRIENMSDYFCDIIKRVVMGELKIEELVSKLSLVMGKIKKFFGF